MMFHTLSDNVLNTFHDYGDSRFNVLELDIHDAFMLLNVILLIYLNIYLYLVLFTIIFTLYIYKQQHPKQYGSISTE